MPEPTETTEFRRAKDFESLYANNVQFEASIWDLKCIFGQLEQKTPTSAVIEQHTAVTLGWAEARLMGYFVLINLINYQFRGGNFYLPASVIPPRPDPNDPKLDPSEINVVKYAAWIHDQFFSDHPFVPEGIQAPTPPQTPQST